jgi:hypothetical protein
MLLRNGKVAMAASTPTNQPMIPQLSGSTDNAPDGELELSILGSQGSRSPSPPVSQLMYDLQPSTNNAPDGQISSPKSPGHQEPHIILAQSVQRKIAQRTNHKDVVTTQFATPLNSISQQRAEPSAPPRHYMYDELIDKRAMEPLSSTISLNDISLMVKPFSGVANAEHSAEKWLHSFELYSQFKNIQGQAKLNLFKLMLTDQAAAWLMALPETITRSWDTMLTAFHQRYGLTEAEKWRFNKEIWSQEQSENQTVDDYVTSMQIRATRVGMPQDTLKDAIIQGLKPELRLFVLNAKVPDIPTLLTVARTCEAARSADKVKSSDDIGQLKAMVNSLINKMDKITGAENDNTTYMKKVTFAQSAVTPAESVRSHDVYDRSSSRRSVSPGDRRDYARNTYGDRPQSPRTMGRQFNTARGGGTQQYVDQTRMTYQNSGPSQPSWRPPQRWSQTGVGTTDPTQRLQYQASRGQQRGVPRRSTPMGNCSFCGRTHAFGRAYCPAASLQCFNCSRLGHIAKMCRQPTTAQSVVFSDSH